MFDIYDVNTYDDVPDNIAVIEGEIIYNKDGNPITFKELTTLIKELLKFINRNGDNYTLSKDNLQPFLHRFTNTYKNEIKKSQKQEIIVKKIIEDDSYFQEIKKSDLIINNYHFSIAQKVMMQYLNNSQKLKLTKIIQKHFQNKEKPYRLQQEIFENYIKVDNYLFKDLCYCKNLSDEQDIMFAYFSGFDTITSLSELDEVLDNEYLNLYPELKQEIKTTLTINLEL